MSRNKKYLEISIKGVKWKVFVESPSYYRKSHGTDSHAVVYPEDYEVYFQKKFMKIGLIRHELIHMYVGSSSVGRMTKTTADDREEHIAGIDEDHFHERSELAEKIQEYIMRREKDDK